MDGRRLTPFRSRGAAGSPRRGPARRRRPLSAVVVAALSLLAGVGPGAAVADARPSWAAAEIRQVLGRGILPGVTPAAFRPQRAVEPALLDALVRGALPRGAAASALRARRSGAYVTISQLDAAFVHAAGLGRDAAAARGAILRVGYTPRADVGTEIAARALGLRYNHPDGQDALEHNADELSTRAEAAWSTAKVLAWRGWEVETARGVMRRLAGLPSTAGARHHALEVAFRLIGQPYVWAGEWETKNGPLGPQAHGGFDCSGFLWRVLALDPGAPKGVLARIGGRSTYDMAGAPGKRLGRAAVRPGDILLFGSNGPRSKPGEVYHAGIDLGNGLMIHSSRQGVQVSRWDEGYHADVFAWGRAVLPG